MPRDVISKIGGSYHLIFNKDQIEFFGWDDKPVAVEIRTNEIVIKKLEGVTITKNPEVRRMESIEVNKNAVKD